MVSRHTDAVVSDDDTVSVDRHGNPRPVVIGAKSSTQDTRVYRVLNELSQPRVTILIQFGAHEKGNHSLRNEGEPGRHQTHGCRLEVARDSQYRPPTA